MQEEGWIVCRAFQKPNPSSQRPIICFNPSCTTTLDDLYSQYPPETLPINTYISSQQAASSDYCGVNNYNSHSESPSKLSTKHCLNEITDVEDNTIVNGSKQLIDWKVLDKLLMSSLSAAAAAASSS